MYKILLHLAVLGLLTTTTSGQGIAPVIKSQRCIGGDGPEETGFGHNLMMKENDGGYVVAGNTRSHNNGDISGGYFDGVVLIDLFVAKLDSAYNIKWQTTLGGMRGDRAACIEKADDGGYIVMGQVLSTDGDVSGNLGGEDVWLVKLDKKGQIQWQKCYGGLMEDYAYHIQRAGDNGYIMVGSSENTNGSPGPVGSSSQWTWVSRIDSIGNILWHKTIPGPVALGTKSTVRPAPDGGFLLAYHKLINGFQDMDVALLKLSATGDSVWAQTYPETEYQYLWDFKYLPDGNILMCGYSSYNGKGNAWLTKCNSNGFKLWQKYRGGSDWDVYSAVITLPDNSILVGGFTASNDNGITTHGGFDYWLVKYDVNGNFIWDKTLGGIGDEYLSNMDYLYNDDIIMYGQTTSSNGDATGNHGSWDGWLVRLSAANVIRGQIYYDLNNNGIKDANEPLTHNAKVLVQHGTQPPVTVIPQNGVYGYAVDTGSYSVKAVPFYDYQTVQPSSYQVSFNNLLNTQTLHFGLQAVPGKQDLAVNIIPVTPARPGFPVQYKIVYRNAGTETMASGSITLDKDRRFNFINAAPQESTRFADHITWDLTHLEPGSSGSIIVNLAVDVNSTHLGDSLVSIAKILPVNGDLTPTDNTTRLSQLVTGSYDPNDKTESNGGIIRPDQVSNGEYLNYLIRFQNTGNDTAFNIFIRDTLESRLDWNSFEMVAASHPYSLEIKDGNKIRWTFKDILLADSGTNEALSHGYIAYRIKPKNTVAIDDTIKNTAAIYFDYNLPVATNAQLTVVRAIPPGAPVMMGLVNNYCSSLGVQKGRLNNRPADTTNATIAITLDAAVLTLAADSSFSFDVSKLAAGSHTITVTFTNAGGTMSTAHAFTVATAVTPDVQVSANITQVTNLNDQVIITAANAANGGKSPLYTFASNRSFTSLLQAESSNNILTIAPASLAIGDNLFYVKMKTSEACYAQQVSIDSITIRRDAATGIIDPDNPNRMINFFPNPFSGPISVTGLDASKKYSITISNLNGQRIYAKRVMNKSNFEITGVQAAAGVYWLSIYDEAKKRLIGSVKMIRR